MAPRGPGEKPADSALSKNRLLGFGRRDAQADQGSDRDSELRFFAKPIVFWPRKDERVEGPAVFIYRGW